MKNIHLVIILPAHNEETVIGSVLSKIPSEIEGVKKITTVVVNDGSTDQTSFIARKKAVVLDHLINCGLGTALDTGITYAKKLKADIAITLDSDGQHDPKDIKRVIQPIIKQNADVVIATRLKVSKGMPWYRVVGNWGLNILTYILYKTWTTDSQSGMRAFGPTALKKISLEFDEMEVSSGFFEEISKHSLIYEEVPIEAIYTRYSLTKGQKNSNGFNILFKLFMKKILR